MSCNFTAVTSQRIDAPVVVTSSRIGEQVIASSERVDDMVIVASERMGVAIAVTTEHIGALPLVTSSIICEIISRKNLLLRDKSLRLLRTRSGKLLYVVK